MRTDDAIAVPKMIELAHEGKRCYQVVGPAGRPLELSELQEAVAPGGSGRFAMLLLADESALKAHGHPEDGHRADFSAFDALRCGPVPIVINEPPLRVGQLESLRLQNPGDFPETTGHFLVGLAQFDSSPLGQCVWNALKAGVMDSCCAVFQARLEAGRAIWQELARVIVVPRRDAGCTAARILWLVEDPLTAEGGPEK